MMVVALPAYLAERGAGPGVVGGLVAMAMLPWSLKIIAGPIMDRWSFLAMGRRRPWVLLAQAGIAIGFVAMSFIADPLANVALISAAAFAVNFFAAFQDVAVDGMAIDVLPVDEHARANGFMWGGQILGIAATTVGGAWLLNALGVQAAGLAAAALVILIMMVPLFLRERPGERLLPWTPGVPSESAAGEQLHGWADIARNLFRAIVMPASLLMVTANFFHRIGVGLLGAVLPVFTVQELGWDDTAFAEWNASARLVTGIGVMLIGGWLVERTGRMRMMYVAGTLNVLAVAGMGLLPELWTTRGGVPLFMGIQLALDSLITISWFAIAMALCRKRVAATQYAMYMAAGNLGFSVGAGFLGPLEGWFGAYGPLFLIVGSVGLVMLAILRFVNLEDHAGRLERMEAGPAPAVN
jgi:PAT family beta-lactamase induction signal transducer AmpG